MDSKELVQRVDGLNSVSTLKNWLSLIKEISGYEFPKSEDKRFMYRKTYDFSEDDVETFEWLVEMKSEHGLRKAIELTFGSLKEEEDNCLAQRFKAINGALRTSEGNVQMLAKELTRISKENVVLRRDLTALQERFNELEEAMSSGVAGRVFGLAKKPFGK